MAEQTLERGSEGQEVSDLQERLIGMRFKPGTVDGVFGVLTESAVKMFQVSVSEEADGIVGEVTREKLDEATTGENEADAG